MKKTSSKNVEIVEPSPAIFTPPNYYEYPEYINSFSGLCDCIFEACDQCDNRGSELIHILNLCELYYRKNPATSARELELYEGVAQSVFAIQMNMAISFAAEGVRGPRDVLDRAFGGPFAVDIPRLIKEHDEHIRLITRRNEERMRGGVNLDAAKGEILDCIEKKISQVLSKFLTSIKGTLKESCEPVLKKLLPKFFKHYFELYTKSVTDGVNHFDDDDGRRPGGGRKPKYDLNTKTITLYGEKIKVGTQVAAVIELAEKCRRTGTSKESTIAYSWCIFRNPPKDIISPYPDAKQLDAAVRRVFNTIGKVFKPPISK